MSEALEREEHIVTDEPSGRDITTSQLEELAAEQQLDPEVRELISRCMAGTEDYGRELKYWEPKRFSPVNITTILLLSAGFRAVEVAQILGIEQQRIAVTKCHPYGQKLLSALLHRQSARVIDIKTRLESYAETMLDTIYQKAVHSDDLKLQTHITFEMLDRAGYGPTQKIESKTERTNNDVSEAAVNRLSSALEESSRVNSAIMPYMKPSVPPAVGGEVIGASQLPSAGAEGGSASSSQSSLPSPLKLLAESND